MDLLKAIFPLSFRAQQKDNFIVALIIYIVADVAAGVTSFLLGGLPLVGIIISLSCSLIGLYATAGVVFSILVFTKVFK